MRQRRETGASEARTRNKYKDFTMGLRSGAVAFFAGLVILSGCSRASGEELRLQGIEELEAGDYEAASRSFAKALSATMGEVGELQYDILRYRAETSFKLSDYEGAADTWRKLKELDENPLNQAEYDRLILTCDAAVANLRGKELMDSGDYEGALAEFDRGLELGDEKMSRILRFNRACCYEYMGDYERALEEFTEYLQEFPDDEEAFKEYNFLKTRV